MSTPPDKQERATQTVLEQAEAPSRSEKRSRGHRAGCKGGTMRVNPLFAGCVSWIVAGNVVALIASTLIGLVAPEYQVVGWLIGLAVGGFAANWSYLWAERRRGGDPSVIAKDGWRR
jgi:hypothetical protein